MPGYQLQTGTATGRNKVKIFSQSLLFYVTTGVATASKTIGLISVFVGLANHGIDNCFSTVRKRRFGAGYSLNFRHAAGSVPNYRAGHFDSTGDRSRAHRSD